MSTSPFAFALCQPGAETWLKAEVKKLRPDLASAFQRPGVVTFKASGEPFRDSDRPETIFGRAWGCSAGPVRTVPEIANLAKELGAKRLLVGPRDQGLAGEVAPARQAAADADAARFEAELRATGAFEAGPPVVGALVIEVVTHPDEPPVVGWRRQAEGDAVLAGGRLGVVVPEKVPSRSWIRLEEGVAWSKVPLKAGQRVLEVGASPGGMTRALVDRGLYVAAVDPQPLDRELIIHPKVRYFPMTIGDIDLDELPETFEWIVWDLNIPIEHSIGALKRVVGRYKSVRGLMMTLNLTDDSVVKGLAGRLLEIKGMGFRKVEARQLPSNRRDLWVFARR